MHPLFRVCLVIFGTLAASGFGPKTPPAFFKNPHPLLTWLGEFTRPAGSTYPQLADSTKFGHKSLALLCPLTEIDTLVLDRGITEDLRARLAAALDVIDALTLRERP